MSWSRCPVCEGRGFVPSRFYQPEVNGFSTESTSITTTKCRSCKGKGIVADPMMPTAPICPQPIMAGGLGEAADSKQLLMETR